MVEQVSVPGTGFLKVLKCFGTQQAVSKISNLMITELFYSHFVDMNRSSFMQEVSGIYTLVFRYRLQYICEPEKFPELPRNRLQVFLDAV